MSKVQYDKIWSYIEAGKQEGATCVLGGEKRSGKGFYVDPTSEWLHADVDRNTSRNIYAAHVA